MTTPNSQKSLNYASSNQLLSSIAKFQPTRIARWLTSIIVALTISCILPLITDASYKADLNGFAVIGFAVILLTLPLYVISGVFKINDQSAKVKAIIMLILLVPCSIYIIYDGVVKTLFLTLIGMSVMVIILRFFDYLKK